MLILLVPFCAGAAVIHIPTDQPTSTAGLAAASSGDTLLLACNTYHEHGMLIPIPVTMASESGDPACATIDGDAAGRIFWIEDADGVVFSGITFTDGQTEFGGAVYADTADVSFEHCVFAANHATREGAGMFYNRGTGVFSDCTFTGNDAVYGGGGVVVNFAAGTFTNCTFTDNEALDGGGVAIYHPGATPVFQDCTFQANRAVGTDCYGGGAYSWNYAAPTFSHCDFIENTSEYGGGGFMSDSECQPVLTDCTFQRNSAVFGGALETWETRGGTVTGCEFTGNTAQGGAGVLHEQSQNLPFTSCTFTDNVATEAGGAFSLYSASPGPVDCTFTGNSALLGGAIAVQYCTNPIISGCWISRNTAQYGGGIGIETCGSPTVTNCALAENAAEYGGALAITHCSTPSLTGSTLVLNRATAYGAGIAIRTSTTLDVERTIIAFSTAGEAAVCDTASISLTVSAVYGNAGGDWVGCIAGQESADNNIATDPYLCGVLAGDYTLCGASPCLPENNIPGFLIGVHGKGCDPPCSAPVEARSWGSIKAMFR
jgi:predicted outer membrane repeat protein